MLSKGQILRARKAMERFYDGTCTITERQPYKRQNGSTGFRTVDVVTDQPCRLDVYKRQRQVLHCVWKLPTAAAHGCITGGMMMVYLNTR